MNLKTCVGINDEWVSLVYGAAPLDGSNKCLQGIRDAQATWACLISAEVIQLSIAVWRRLSRLLTGFWTELLPEDSCPEHYSLFVLQQASVLHPLIPCRRT